MIVRPKGVSRLPPKATRRKKEKKEKMIMKAVKPVTCCSRGPVNGLSPL